MESIRMNRIKIKTLHFHPNQHRTKRPTGFIRPTATTRYSNPTTQKRETAWDKNRIIQTIKKAENLNKIKAFCPFLCMREMGLEPTRAYTHKILSLACLPIPALPRAFFLWKTSDIISLKNRKVNTFFEKNTKKLKIDSQRSARYNKADINIRSRQRMSGTVWQEGINERERESINTSGYSIFLWDRKSVV